MKLPSLFSNGLLSNSGDRLEARITSSNRKVIKLHKDNGRLKLSSTEYPNGTIVKTLVEKRK